MDNSYITDIIGNKNFQNNQNYVFPHKDSVLKIVNILDFEVFGLSRGEFFIVIMGFYGFCIYLSIKFRMFSGFFIGLSFLALFVLFILVCLYISRYFIFILLILSNYNSIFTKAYTSITKLIISLFKEKYKKIYYFGEGIYLIYKGKGKYKKKFYIKERFKFLKK